MHRPAAFRASMRRRSWRLCFFVQTAQTVLPGDTGRRKHDWHFHRFLASLRFRCMYPRRWTRLAAVRG